MATLAENAAAVKAAQVAIDAAIVAKGGTTDGGLNNAAAGIKTIQIGSTWRPPSNWPNLMDIMKADDESESPHGKTARNRVAVLIYSSSISVSKSTYYEDGKTYKGNGKVVTSGTITFPSQGLHWMITWSDDDLTLGEGSSAYLWIFGDPSKSTIVDARDYNNIAYKATMLESVENCTVKSVYRNFFGNMQYSVKTPIDIDYRRSDAERSIGPLNLSCCPKISGFYGTQLTSPVYEDAMANCFSATEIPDFIDASMIRTTSLFGNLRSLHRLPKVICPNLVTADSFNYNFSSSPNINPDSLAKFSDGSIVGGFASFLDAIPDKYSVAAGKTSSAIGAEGTITMTLSTRLRDMFSEVEHTAIASAFNTHGWTLVWA